MSANMFLKFEGPDIHGASTEAGREGEIEVLSWSHGFSQPGSASRGTVEQASHQNFTFTKYLDSATNALLKACWSGKQFRKATLTCYRGEGANRSEYLSVIMEHVILSNYSVSGGPGDVPVENISLDYGIVQYQYKEQKSRDGGDPNLPAKHNLETKSIE
ncbi:MAG TPA: type VI secretion system tube protein Hcp [Thermoanaerobaculia bacterium]|nr:type VI secretion system tube protein Hcp [Thermoanaerobaculia bacterium]